MNPDVVEVETCPLCGGSLQAVVSGCHSCPMNSGCDMLCCDNCGYSTVATQSKTIDFFKRVVSRIPIRIGRGAGS